MRPAHTHERSKKCSRSHANTASLVYASAGSMQPVPAGSSTVRSASPGSGAGGLGVAA